LAEVRLQDGESLENALRRFKRKVQTEDIIKDVKRHSFYLKPGEKKRLKASLARSVPGKSVAKSQTKMVAEMKGLIALGVLLGTAMANAVLGYLRP